ncbi:receptor-like protein 12 [Chenopodium quinoa]|uniref:receptor-like protein 12 n=1 Tax=Chenopodium quinoa TaxID=63459 RepID=UPI000B76F474|nr:receptor-like protein 12 [Chenopodium quinoa]
MGKSYSCLQYLCVVVWLVVHLLCQCGQFAAAAGNSSSILCKQRERQALLKIKQILIAHNSSVKVGSWVGENCCQWQGVGFDYVTGNIILLNIINPDPNICSTSGRICYDDGCYYNSRCLEIKDGSLDHNIFGSMITILQGLKYLTHLKLYGLIFGRESTRIMSFSKVIGTMTQLRYLNLSSVGLVGEILSQIGNLTNLQVLDLSNNFLQGNVPPQIGNLTNLQVLYLSDNNLEGNVPPQIGNLTNLQVLDLSNNQFDRELRIMRWASSLSNLQFLDLSNIDLSQLTVDAWRILSQLPSLSHLGLSGCNLKNNHLSHVFSNDSAIILNTLHYLDLSSNLLKNPLTILGNLSSLSFLDLSNNLLEGSVPGWLKNMRSLQVLNLARNGFSHVENGIWGIMGNLCNFIHLDLSYNLIHGEILEPANISSCISYSLESLDLSFNNISGNLPSFLGQLTNLRQLDFSENKLSGEIPDCLGQLTNLKDLDFSDNKLSGEIPDCLGQLTNLKDLDFSDNKLSGEIPDCLGQLTNRKT